MRIAAWWLVLALAACAPAKPPVEQPPISTGQTVSPPRVAETPLPPELCPSLKRIVDARLTDFAELKSAPLDERRFTALLVPPGLNRCEIQGRRGITARYVCRSSGYLGGGPAAIRGDFDSLASAIGQCLDRDVWAPRDWREGQRLVFADDEQQIVWRDIGRALRQEIGLKMERDFAQDRFYLRLEIAPRS